MNRPRHTYHADAPQLTLTGVPSPQAQGTMFDPPAHVVTATTAAPYPPCVTCGTLNGPRSDDGTQCLRCVEVGVTAPELALTPTQQHRARCAGQLMRPIWPPNAAATCAECGWRRP